MRFPYHIFLLAVLTLGSSAYAQQSLSPTTCSDDATGAAFQKKGQLLTRDLSLALMTGDLETMGARFKSLNDVLKTCGDLAPAKTDVAKQKLNDHYMYLCDADCHLTMAQYMLLLAADMPFLSSKTESALDPGTAQINAENGRVIVDRGLNVLARQYAPTPDAQAQTSSGDASSSQGKPSLFNFTFKQSRLLEAKARLLMAAGDNWYMTTSNQQLSQLGYEITAALNKTGEGGTQGNAANNQNMEFAQNFYREALWLIVEAKTDIPNMTVYSSLTSELSALQRDLETRIGSAEKGYLFLNIDPQELNLSSYDVINQGLVNLTNEISTIESKIEGLIKDANNAKLAADLKDASNDVSKQLKREADSRYQTSQNINLSLQKIGQLQESYSKMTQDTEAKINTIEAEKETANYRREINRIAFDLGEQKKEVDYKIQYLKAKKDQDMLAYSIGNKTDQLSEVRWLMNHKITVSNLEIQVLSFQAQISEYDRAIKRNNDDIAAIDEALIQKTLTTNSITEREGQIDKESKILDNQMQYIYRRKRVELRTQICNMETQVAMLSGTGKLSRVFEPMNFKPLPEEFTPPNGAAPLETETACEAPSIIKTFTQYQADVCKIRKDMGSDALKAQGYVLKCLLGKPLPGDFQVAITCPDIISADPNDPLTKDFTNKRLLTEQILNKNRDSALLQYNALKTLRDDFKNKVDSWMKVTGEIVQNIERAKSLYLIAASTYGALAGTVPTYVGAIAGPMGGVVTIMDTESKVKALSTNLLSLVNFVENAANREMAFHAKKAEMELKIGELGAAIDKLFDAYTVEKLQYQMTFLELGVTESSEIAKTDSAVQQHKLMLLECDSKELTELDARLDNFVSNHQALLARLDLMAQENISTQLQMDDLASQKIQQGIQRKIIASERNVLDNRRALLVNDNNDIRALQGNVKERVTNTTKLQSELATDKKFGDSLVDEIKGMKYDALQKSLDLSDKEADFLKDQLDDKTVQAAADRKSLDDKIKDVGLEESLRQGLLASFDSIAGEIAVQRKNVLDMSTQTAADGGITPIDGSRELFEVSRDQMFDLVRGLPDYLIAKKRKIDIANRLAFMAYKKRDLFRKLGGIPSPEDFTYMRSSESLVKFTNTNENGILFSTEDKQVVIGYTGIDIPSDSAFAQALARNGEVTFQVSPAAAGKMDALGHLSIWPNDIDNANKFSDPEVRLVDVLIVGDYRCPEGSQVETTNNQITIAHLGHGFVFKKADKDSDLLLPSLENVPSRSWTDSVYRFSEGQQGDLPAALNSWTTKSPGYTVGSFDKDIPDNRAKLPFLGYPIIANYKLTAEASDCSRIYKNPVTGETTGVAYKLFFVYARPKKN
ncbi:MAG TPA: hypothetical protein VE954_03425 [Oligoflexus sp.]|uniref:hypothetical protein n=1 Tax=Oligoflexus sp. TaxID=1971216 RepID=UPI002D5AF0CF|nr:hypothetical protein [Oligoflexus sp.]HYX32138.1 hypothetical protein [Oligoflexus sp.]